jgi:thiol-disulfide isomerase/thioredoxin
MENQNINLNKVNTSKKLAQIIKQNFIVIIKISASWCGPCKNEKFIKSYNNIKSKYINNQNIKFVELDIDIDNEILEDKKYYNIEIESIPTFLISNNGSFIKKFIGLGYMNEIKEYISNTLLLQ